MNESDGMTIRIRTEKPVGPPPPPMQALPDDRRRWSIKRSLVAVVATSITIAGGWFAVQYVSSTPHINENDSLEELEGFESSAPLFAAPNQPHGDEISLGPPSDVTAVPPLELGVPLPADLPGEVVNADVWLTGTIEDADLKEKIPLPTKLSGGPNESSVVR